MATKAEPVGSDQAGKPGVQEITTTIPGVGPVKAYFQVSTVDDFDGKTTEDVETYRFSIPRLIEKEQQAVGEDGEYATEEDGSPKLETVKVWKTVAYEIDLGEASREKFLKAIEPYADKAREVAAPVVATPVKQTSTSAHDLNAIRSWAKSAGHDVKEKGRIAGNIITAYYRATGKTNPDA
ncbi:histone-like nucleoid-structuring protein Lsr2 [Streptomyces halstedii]|uniref:Lsr2 family DNA-binding protein n=1 Tax=Streptomyces halstedii TaxID=1944 RepID=UPI0037CFB1EC